MVIPEFGKGGEFSLCYIHSVLNIAATVAVALGFAAQVDKRVDIVYAVPLYGDMGAGIFSILSLGELDCFISERSFA